VIKILTLFIATYASILISSSSSMPRDTPSAVARTLPYRRASTTHSFGGILTVPQIIGAGPLDQ